MEEGKRRRRREKEPPPSSLLLLFSSCAKPNYSLLLLASFFLPFHFGGGRNCFCLEPCVVFPSSTFLKKFLPPPPTRLL